MFYYKDLEVGIFGDSDILQSHKNFYMPKKGNCLSLQAIGNHKTGYPAH